MHRSSFSRRCGAWCRDEALRLQGALQALNPSTKGRLSYTHRPAWLQQYCELYRRLHCELEGKPSVVMPQSYPTGCLVG